MTCVMFFKTLAPQEHDRIQRSEQEAKKAALKAAQVNEAPLQQLQHCSLKVQEQKERQCRVLLSSKGMVSSAENTGNVGDRFEGVAVSVGR